MTNLQVGETVKYLPTGSFFQVEKVTPKLVILKTQDSLMQIKTPTERFELVFEKMPPAESFWKDLISRSESPVPPKGRGKGGKIEMKACENHYESIVVFNGDVCPFCRVEKRFKTIGEEVEKTMEIMKQIQMMAKEAGLKTE